MKRESNWDYVLRPKRKWFDINLAEIWNYRDLLRIYSRRNIVVTYRQTVLGPLWFVLQPLFTIVIYMFIFGGLARLSTEGIPQPLFYMSGILMWNYFSDSFGASSNVLASNSDIFGKVYFPRLVVPLAGMMSNLVKLCIQLSLFIVIYLLCLFADSALDVNWTVCLVPFLFLMLALHGLGWGLLVSAFTYKYRDLQLFLTYALQLLMFATPVVYSLNTIPESYRFIVSLNPLTPVFETFKYGCFNVGFADWGGLLYSLVWLVVVLGTAILLFNRVERNFVDSV